MSYFDEPDRERAIARQRALAANYDDSCRGISRVHEAAVAALALRPGETAFDIACGTGRTFPLPWQLLSRVCADFRMIRTFHAGSTYLAAATLTEPSR